jgi:ArsR family transcriptional regulator, virulence genes transcriptional regulator
MAMIVVSSAQGAEPLQICIFTIANLATADILTHMSNTATITDPVTSNALAKGETLFSNLADFEAKAAEAAQLLRALSHEKRLMILCQIGGGEMSVGALQAVVGLSQSALSQHLAVLRAEGLVETRRQSQTIFYAISDPAVMTIIAALQSVFCPDLPPHHSQPQQEN